MLFEAIDWWKDAYHVIEDGKRVGIVNAQRIVHNGVEVSVWFAHNAHFMEIKMARGSRKTIQFASQRAAALALLPIPKKPD